MIRKRNRILLAGNGESVRKNGFPGVCHRRAIIIRLRQRARKLSAVVAVVAVAAAVVWVVVVVVVALVVAARSPADPPVGRQLHDPAHRDARHVEELLEMASPTARHTIIQRDGDRAVVVPPAHTPRPSHGEARGAEPWGGGNVRRCPPRSHGEP